MRARAGNRDKGLRPGYSFGQVVRQYSHVRGAEVPHRYVWKTVAVEIAYGHRAGVVPRHAW